MARYAALTVWEDEGIFVDVVGPCFSTSEEAEVFARDMPLTLLLHQFEGQTALTLMSTNSLGFSMNPERSQVFISYAPRKENAPPLDPSNPSELQIILDSMGDMDSPYCITENDLIPLDWSFEKLAGMMPSLPRRFSSMSYGVKEIS